MDFSGVAQWKLCVPIVFQRPDACPHEGGVRSPLFNGKRTSDTLCVLMYSPLSSFRIYRRSLIPASL
eukprot:2050518-Rhodomonas_salina.1